MSLFGMRLALVGPLPPPSGGMATQTLQLAELLRNEGLQVDLVQTNAAYRPAWIAYVPVLRALFRLMPYLLALWRRAAQCDLFHVMANSGWSWHLFAAPAIWIAHLRGKPVVVHYHGGEAEAFLGQSARCVSLSLRQASSLIVPSGFLKSVFGRFGLAAMIVPNVVDLSCFNHARPHLGARRNFFVPRNLEPVYDNETALQAFAVVHRIYPDARLTIAGSGPSEVSLRAMARSLGVDGAVEFAGRMDRQAMASAYQRAAVVVNPSLADNMPVSILEALASGVPVVSTDVGGIRYLVKHEHSALLVPPRSPKAMAEAMLRLMDDVALSERLVGNGLTEAQKYTWSRVWPVLSDVYRTAARPSLEQWETQ